MTPITHENVTPIGVFTCRHCGWTSDVGPTHLASQHTNAECRIRLERQLSAARAALHDNERCHQETLRQLTISQSRGATANANLCREENKTYWFAVATLLLSIFVATLLTAWVGFGVNLLAHVAHR
jgi:hypothetical protein